MAAPSANGDGLTPPGQACMTAPMTQTSPQTPDILCIGSVLWDIIGRSHASMRLGSDVPGRITRLPGGVAMNIAMTLARFGLRHTENEKLRQIWAQRVRDLLLPMGLA